MSVDAGAAEHLWNELVDQHVDTIWRIATTAGLESVEAAVVSQLTWLRMAERWPTVRALASSKNPDVHPVDQPADQVDEWILHTARSEVDAWLGDLNRRARESAFNGVARMAPGFSPADAGGPPR